MPAEKDVKASEPKPPPFLADLADTADMIGELRTALEAIEAQRRALDEQANDLTAKIAAFATLRQAHGLPLA